MLWKPGWLPGEVIAEPAEAGTESNSAGNPREHIHSPDGGYLGCFQLGIIMNKAAMNIHAQTFLWTQVFNSLGYNNRSGIAGSSIFMFNFLRNCQTVFRSG